MRIVSSISSRCSCVGLYGTIGCAYSLLSREGESVDEGVWDSIGGACYHASLHSLQQKHGIFLQNRLRMAYFFLLLPFPFRSSLKWDHASLWSPRYSCTFGRSPRAGPFRIFPNRSNLDPWHGQSHDFSKEFHATMHWRWGQTAEHWWRAPSSSR